jgi:hypothetical protein
VSGDNILSAPVTVEITMADLIHGTELLAIIEQHASPDITTAMRRHAKHFREALTEGIREVAR